jgi:outer membrane lipoprotein-sorting protein
MKRKITAILLALALCAALLAGCGGSGQLKGAYKSSESILSQTWTFSGTDSVTLSAGGGLIATEGTYTLSGDKMTITSSLFGQETVTSYTVIRDGKNIIVDGTVFYKQ